MTTINTAAKAGAPKPATAAKPTAATKPGSKPASKLDTLEKLLGRKNGASIGEMVQATGWQQHSVRGALAGAMKKRGHAVTSDKVDGVRRYHIAEAGQ